MGNKAAKKQKVSGETEAELGLLEERLDSSLGKALKEMGRVQEQLGKCEREGVEERDAKIIEGELPTAMELVTQVELAAEEANTEEKAMKARDLIGSCRQRVEKTLDKASNFAPEAQKLALAEFTSLRDRCDAADKRLS